MECFVKFAAIALSVAVSAFAYAHAQDPVVKVYRVSGSANGLVALKSSGEMAEISGLGDETVSEILASVPSEEVFTFSDGSKTCVTDEDGECQSNEDMFRNIAASCAAGATTGLPSMTPWGVASGCIIGAAGAAAYNLVHNAGCTPPPPPPPPANNGQ
jgi:hypothetical protein